MILKADLHIHTKLSDGTVGIDDIVILAKNAGVTTISITDHDCLAGTVRAEMIGNRYGVNVIPGVEFSATDSKRKSKVHILCYLPDKPERLEGLCKSNSLLRKRAGVIMLKKVANKFPISKDFILRNAQGSTNIFKQHILKALMECGYTTEIFGDLHKKLFSKDSPMNVSMDPTYPEPQEIIEAIHEAGGIAVLANPQKCKNDKLLDQLVEAGLDGIEIYTPDMPEEDKVNLAKYAKKHKILTTGGSNFKGLYNKSVISIGDCDLPDECVQELNTYKARKKKAERKKAQA